MATRSQRRARQRERMAAKSAREIARNKAMQRMETQSIIASNRIPSEAELLELRAWRGVTDSTLHLKARGAHKECGNHAKISGMSDHATRQWKKAIAKRNANG